MFENSPKAERVKLLKHLFTCIEKDYLLSGKPRRARETFTLLGAALGEQAMVSGDIDYLFKFCAPSAKDEKEAISKGQNLIGAAFYRFVGSTPEIALRFCRLLFRGQVQYIEEHRRRVAEGECTDDEFYEEDLPFIPHVIYLATSSPYSDSRPQKEWLLRIIELTDAGNHEAEDFLRRIIESLDYISVYLGSKTEVVAQEDLDGSTSRDEFMLPNFQNLVSQIKNQFIVPHRLRHVVVGLLRSMQREVAKDFAKSEIFGKWFMDHSSQLSAVFDSRQREILENPRYGIRPFGFDSVLVDVSPLNSVGIKSFSFHAEGECFPNVKLEVNVRKTGVGIFTYWAYFRDFTLHCDDEILNNWQNYDLSFLRAVFEYIIVDALFHIICREPQKNKAGEVVQRAAYSEDRVSRQQIVRPFLRRLPSGYRASDHARNLAFIYHGWVLPDGITFVQSHSRWANLPSTKPAPLFAYTDETVMKSIE
ncbi:MAG: hypothetical protein WC289_00015 [Patescibacteria group bacterium]